MLAVLDRLQVTRSDAALAIVLVACGLVQTAVRPIADPGVAGVYVVGSMLPIAWRRTRPVESALVASAFWLVPLDGYPVLGFVAVILQFFALGDRGRPTLAVVLTTGVASTTAVVGTLLGPEAPVAAIGAVLVVVAPVLAGRLVRHLRSQNDALVELTGQLRDERERAEQAAVGAERGRIAQELHDVVGHELTLIAIQAEAAGSALRNSPQRAVEPVESIRTTAHRALAEIRDVLGVLAPTDQTLAAGGLEELSRRAAAAGIENSLEVSGAPWDDHAPAALAVNRIVRECLTNAGRHAPGEPVRIRVAWQPREVMVSATNRTSRTRVEGRGRGLTGMRHRAELLGGSFEARCADGCFEVRVRLPARTGAS